MAPDLLNPSPELKHVLLWLVPLLIIAPTVIFLYLQAVGNNKKNPIRLPPSPLRLPIIGNLHLMVHDPHRSLQRLARSLGPVIHLQLGGVATVVLSSPEAAKEVLKTHDVHCCSRPPSPGAKLMTYGQQDIAFSPYNASWRELRKLFVSELVSSKRIQSFSHALEAQVGELIQSLSLTTEPVNLNETLFTLIDSFIGTVAFGSMKGAPLMKYTKFQRVFSEATVALSAFSAQDFFPASPMSRWFDKLVGLERRYLRTFLEIDSYLEMVLTQHMDPGRVKPDKDDLVDVLISLWKGQGKITKDHVKALLGDAFIGGTATNSVTLLWAMSELIKNPTVMKKAQAEIRSLVGGKQRLVQVDDLSKLKYMKMVVKETLRLHAPVPLLVPRETMDHVKVLGYDIPAKTRIFVNVWAMGRDPASWEKPEEFYPERFDGVDTDFYGSHYELLPFGAGRRICPAIPMGSTMVEFTLASLLHSFDWELPKGMNKEDVSMEGTGDNCCVGRLLCTLFHRFILPKACIQTVKLHLIIVV